MSRARRASAARPSPALAGTYAQQSTRPLHVLAFLLPLIILYEVGTAAYLTHPGVVDTIGARGMIRQFFSAFGPASFYLPGIMLTGVLVLWHLLVKDAWRVYPTTLLGMFFESVLWVLPLIVFGQLLLGGQHAPALGGEDVTARTWSDLNWQSRVTLAVGAGIYEELLFRLILVTGVHFLLVDLLRLSHGVGAVIAVIVSAIAFAFYHHSIFAGGQVNLLVLTFYIGAGLYFAGLFLWRGFGIVVGTHAVYDIVVLVLLASK